MDFIACALPPVCEMIDGYDITSNVIPIVQYLGDEAVPDYRDECI